MLQDIETKVFLHLCCLLCGQESVTEAPVVEEPHAVICRAQPTTEAVGMYQVPV